MNSETKPFLKGVYDLYVLGDDVATKQYAKSLTDVVAVGEDIPTIVANWPSMKSDLVTLGTNPAADADLLAYFATLSSGQGAAVEGLVSALATAGLNGYQDYVAVKAAFAALKAPATTPVAPSAS